MKRVAFVSVVVFLLLARALPAQGFKLAPAVAVEAEDFTVEKGWKVLKNGEGNYMVDIIGFNHISGERLLAIDEKDETASAHADVAVPEAGPYRLWVRYEYPAFCETRFRVRVVQDGKVVLDHVMGKKDSPRYAFGDPVPKAQHDPSWGPEGLHDEVVTVPALKKGPARIYLQGAGQPQVQGVSAGRHIDLVYLTRDTADAWIKHYAKHTKLYPILDAFRDSRGPRWEVRVTNRADKPARFHIAHIYNRLPWGASEPDALEGVKPGEASRWVGLAAQDTAHFAMVLVTSSAGALDVEVRPAGGGKLERKLAGTKEVHFYLPPYPARGEGVVTPEEAISAILAELKKQPVIGKKPTKPLCYGGWMPLGQEGEYGKKYAELYATLGFVSLHPAHSGPKVLENLKDAGIPLTKSWMAMGYRNPPTKANIELARTDSKRRGLEAQLRFFDYGDEIAFSEWLGMLVAEELASLKAAGQKATAEQVIASRWINWLRANRSTVKLGEYWQAKWGPFNALRLRPDSSAEAARTNPRLYVDSLLFYEGEAIAFAAKGAQMVRKELGADVLCGANYSCHPFYYPHSTMYIKWFRGNAADLGRHSEYFWQVAQAGPMVNGYIAEHFMAGMRHNDKAVLRQYTMPHAPGNTDASFLRSAYSHLAHGATMLDFFSIGLNESFTENHIDHRARSRYVAVREATHAVGFVEDLLPGSRPVPSPVALLVSESTERWDFAGIAEDRAGHAHFGPDFRKARLNYHLDRLGMWTALTFLGVSPDLLIEEDLTEKELARYRVLVVVGDCLPPSAVPVLERWVRNGGVVLATCSAGSFDSYRAPNPAWSKFLGVAERKVDGEAITFIRPRQELPFLRPLATVVGEGWKMPQLAVAERVKPAEGVQVLAKLEGGGEGAGLLERRVDKGRVYYVAAHPGLAYLWSALQPPAVPDRGPRTHTVPTGFDKGAQAVLELALRAGEVRPVVTTSPGLIDGRLLKAEKGYIVPLANYNGEVGQKVTVKVRVGGGVGKVTSARHGVLPHKVVGGVVEVTLPALGYGDVLRVDP